MESPLVGKIHDYISSEKLPLRAGDCCAVALSGGADSVALLLVLRELGVSVTALHCNFHLRGEESMRDERFCRDLCSRLGVSLEVRDFSVGAAPGESVEMACRRLRYAWWDALDGNIAVAHHADDNAETLLLNLMRGSGVSGLKGMLPRRGKYLRPLLGVRRAELIEFLESRGESHVTDSTNLESDFRRNRIRNVVLPFIEEHFPGATEGIIRSVECLRGDYGRLLRDTDRLRDRFLADGKSVGLRKLCDEVDDPVQALYAMLSPFGINFSQAAEMIAASASSGQKWRCPQGEWINDRGILTFCDSPVHEPEYRRLDDSSDFELRRVSRREFAALVGERRSDIMFLDASVLASGKPIIVRRWREGDRMAPFGMKGTRLLSDIFNDRKIGAVTREMCPVLEHDGKILWVAGVRASRHWPVMETTEEIIMIKYTGSCS